MTTITTRAPKSQEIDLRLLKSRLADRAEDFVLKLLGEPKSKTRRYWRWGNKGSLSYDLKRHRWRSFEADCGGDLLDLICFATPGWDLRQAIEWAKTWSGDVPFSSQRRNVLFSPTDDKTDLALRIWREGKPAHGTIVQTYVEGRGLRLPELSDHVLRFHQSCPRGNDRLPAMLGLMRDIGTDRPVGVHRTFLSPDGKAKAAISPAKMMLGPAHGAVWKLTPDAEVTMGLGITEGIEDALAVFDSGWRPVWACLSAGTMNTFPVLQGIEALTVFQDNDSAGARAATSCVARWRHAGKEACVVEPESIFKDFGAVAEAGHHV